MLESEWTLTPSGWQPGGILAPLGLRPRPFAPPPPPRPLRPLDARACSVVPLETKDFSSRPAFEFSVETASSATAASMRRTSTSVSLTGSSSMTGPASSSRTSSLRFALSQMNPCRDLSYAHTSVSGPPTCPTRLARHGSLRCVVASAPGASTPPTPLHAPCATDPPSRRCRRNALAAPTAPPLSNTTPPRPLWPSPPLRTSLASRPRRRPLAPLLPRRRSRLPPRQWPGLPPPLATTSGHAYTCPLGPCENR